MTTILWFIGVILVGSILFYVVELFVGIICLKTLKEIDPEAADFVSDEEGDIPISVFPHKESVIGMIHDENLPLFQKGHARLKGKLKGFGLLFGILEVLVGYFVLSFFSVTSNFLYWSLLYFPLQSFSKLGKRKLPEENLMMGEVQAFLHRIFLSSFTTFSLLTVIGIQVLRYFDVIF